MSDREMVKAFASWALARWRDFRQLILVVFGKAWVSTVAMCLVYLLFFRSDQAQDILSGIRSGCDLALNGQADSESCSQSLRQYWWFFLATVLLAVELGLVTYSAGEPWSWKVRPNKLQPGRNHRVRRLWALVVLLGSLAMPHLQFLKPQPNVPTLEWILPYVGVNLLIFVPALLMLKLRSRAAWLGVLAWGWPVVWELFFFCKVFAESGAAGLPRLASRTVTAAALLIVVALRYRLRETKWQIGILIMALVPLLLSFVFVSTWAKWAESWVMAIGSLPVVLIFVALVTLVLAIGNRLIEKCRVPIGAVLAFLLAMAFYREEKPESQWSAPATPGMKETAQLAKTLSPTAKGTENFGKTAAISERATSKVRLAVSADGGGLRAALFTAEALSLADDITCGEFGQHVAAASGVSGGSLGIATWAVMRQEYEQLAPANSWVPWAWCKDLRAEQHLEPGAIVSGPAPVGPVYIPTPEKDFFGGYPLTDRVRGALVQDHLAPVLARMLTIDALSIGAPKRGQALLQSWQNAAVDVLRYGQTRKWDFRAYLMPLSDVTAGVTSTPPILLFTATTVETGRREVFSNASELKTEHLAPQSVPIGLAALNSARFPIISPAGVLQEGKLSIHLVDGGFFDNSGAATLREWLSTVTDPSKVILARLDGNESEEDRQSAVATCISFSEKLQERTGVRVFRDWRLERKNYIVRWSGLEAYEHARQAHAEESVRLLAPVESSLQIAPHVCVETGAEAQPCATARNPASSVLDSALRLRYLANFDQQCLAGVSQTKPGDAFEECVKANIKVCAAARDTPRAPLGWYVSPGSAEGIGQIALNAAVQLVCKVVPQKHGICELAARTEFGKR